MAKKKKKKKAIAQQDDQRFSLKDHLFNRRSVKTLADQLAEADPDFAAADFQRQVMRGFAELELKQRISRITEALQTHLPSSFAQATRLIVNALPPRLDPSKTDDDFGEFIFAPYGEYVAREGLNTKHLKRSLATLREITMRFSMEDAIRRFINRFPEETFAVLGEWATDSNYHVRRLVSEGTRPMLPWSGRLETEISRPLQLLDSLHADPTRYVTRSVANHLNDISKSAPQLVLQTLRRWKSAKRQETAELEWIQRHALRTLVKQGHVAALKLLGYRPKPEISIEAFVLKTPRVRAGETLEFSVDLQARRRELLMVDYVIEFVKANGKLAAKVFKAKQLELDKHQSIRINKRHPLKANATTFKLNSGTHYLTLQINGTQWERIPFELTL